MAVSTAKLRRVTPGGWAVTLLIGVVAVLWLIPLWMVVITAMKTTTEYVQDSSQWQLPQQPLNVFANIAQAWSTSGMGPGFEVSLLYGVVGAGLAIAFASLGAYAITWLPIRGRFFWFVLVFSGTIFPFQMYLIPLFKLYQDIGLYDTQLGMILFYTAIAIPFCLFVMRGFLATIPREQQEAARLDGSGDLGIFLRIIMPQARGAIAVLFLFQFTWIWNDLLFGLVLTTSDGVRPVSPSLAGLQGQFAHTGPPIILAAALLATLPTIITFLLLGRYMMRGLTLTTAGRAE
jgi:ABC-type glycerol-3-phosphate transport system permease component